MRIIGPAMGTGQAAGLAVCTAIDRGVMPRELDGVEVRALLVEQGVELDKPTGGFWAELRANDGELTINKGDAISIAPKKPGMEVKDSGEI